MIRSSRLRPQSQLAVYLTTCYSRCWGRVARNNAQQRKSKLLSFGIGYANETKTGLLNFSYAFGKTNKESFDLNRGLFHLKWVNFF